MYSAAPGKSAAAFVFLVAVNAGVDACVVGISVSYPEDNDCIVRELK